MPQVLPKYYFSGEYADLYPILSTLPHAKADFKTGDFLWNIGEAITKVFYFHSGCAQTYVEHEDGYRKILFFLGTDTMFPGVQQADYKIEKSIAVQALTNVTTTVFDRDIFYQCCLEHSSLMTQLCEMQSAYINTLIYDAAHQRFNNLFLKLCNFLFLMANVADNHTITITQEIIADTLGVGRNHVTKGLSRLRKENIIQVRRRFIEITDMDKLAAYCSQETLDKPFL